MLRFCFSIRQIGKWNNMYLDMFLEWRQQDHLPGRQRLSAHQRKWRSCSISCDLWFLCIGAVACVHRSLNGYLRTIRSLYLTWQQVAEDCFLRSPVESEDDSPTGCRALVPRSSQNFQLSPCFSYVVMDPTEIFMLTLNLFSSQWIQNTILKQWIPLNITYWGK